MIVITVALAAVMARLPVLGGPLVGGELLVFACGLAFDGFW
jgi:hypothetical protein